MSIRCRAWVSNHWQYCCRRTFVEFVETVEHTYLQQNRKSQELVFQYRSWITSANCLQLCAHLCPRSFSGRVVSLFTRHAGDPGSIPMPGDFQVCDVVVCTVFAICTKVPSLHQSAESGIPEDWNPKLSNRTDKIRNFSLHNYIKTTIGLRVGRVSSVGRPGSGLQGDNVMLVIWCGWLVRLLAGINYPRLRFHGGWGYLVHPWG